MEQVYIDYLRSCYIFAWNG